MHAMKWLVSVCIWLSQYFKKLLYSFPAPLFYFCALELASQFKLMLFLNLTSVFGTVY